MSSEELAERVDVMPESDEGDSSGKVRGKRSGIERVYLHRFLALMIDFALLKVFGSLCVWAGLDQLLAMGDWALPLSLGILGVYFVMIPLLSKHAASPGMIVMNLEVVNEHMERPSKRKVFFRYTLLVLILYNMEIGDWPRAYDDDLRSGLLDIVLFPPGLLWMGNLYLAIFNRSSGQYFHDALFGLYVLKAESSDKHVLQKIWDGHILAIIMISILPGITGVAYLKFMIDADDPILGFIYENFDDMEKEVETAFSGDKNLKKIWVYTDPDPEEYKIMHVYTIPAGTPSIDVNLDLRQYRSLEAMKPLLDDIVEKTLTVFSGVSNFEVMKVSWDYEVPFLIRDVYSDNSIEMTLEEWRAYIEEKDERGLESLPHKGYNNFRSGIGNMFSPGSTYSYSD